MQNNLTRNYESNGPDVKIRGTASHIAEKYIALARDAVASGDTVTGENYLQHAEHYPRIIMAAQAQQAAPGQSGEGANGAGGSSGNRRNGPAEETNDNKQPGEVAAEAEASDGKARVARKGKQSGNGSGSEKAEGKTGEREPADSASEETPDEAVT